MEWVETTARTREEATELALDQLGVVLEEAEVVVLEEPRQGLFGRMRGEARVRARVKPASVRPKHDRRRGHSRSTAPASGADETERTRDRAADQTARAPASSNRRRRRSGRSSRGPGETAAPVAATELSNLDSPTTHPDHEGTAMTPDDPSNADAAATTDDVRQAAVHFVTGLTEAFGFDATVDTHVDGNEIEVRVNGSSLGLLIGPGGRTLLGIQDLARVAAQRRLRDHDTRLRVDVAGYREKRRQALERFASNVAEQVRETGVARSLDPMPSADRKVLHDALASIDGVASRSEGEEPNRRVIVEPA